MSCPQCLHCKRAASPLKAGDRIWWQVGQTTNNPHRVVAVVEKVNVGSGTFYARQYDHPTEKFMGWDTLASPTWTRIPRKDEP